MDNLLAFCSGRSKLAEYWSKLMAPLRIARVGVDVSHALLQVHAVDALDNLVATRRFSRADFFDWCAQQLPSGTVVAMEACGTAHHLARQLAAQGLEPRLMAPSFVVPFRISGKGAKNDANDAAAICEAASRPMMRFVRVKTQEQQAMLAVHRLREGFVEQRTAWTNRTRGVLAEAGVFERTRGSAFRSVLRDIAQDVGRVPSEPLRAALVQANAHLEELGERIDWCDRQIAQHAKGNIAVQKAMTVPGVGVLTASAVVATVDDFRQFRNGRQFSAWLGLVPSQRSSGALQRLGRITKRGDKYLRKLLVMGGRSVLYRVNGRDDSLSLWAAQLRKRVGWGKAQVAVANKTARLLWRTEATIEFSAAQVAEASAS